MFAVDGWKLPHVVPQKAERKNKRKETPAEGSEQSRAKKVKANSGAGKTAAVAKTSKKDGKDKSKYMPYSKEKGSSGANNLPVAKERKPRPKSPSPPPKPVMKAQGSKKDSRPEKAPLARPPRSERDKTPPRLLAKEPPPTFTGLAHNKHLTPLQQKMAAKLSGARFRWINETLYTSTGSDALQLIKEKPEMFDEYHAGFRSQVADWPSNPIDIYKARLEEVVKSASGKKLVVADLGCGEAMLAKRMLELDPQGKRVSVKSFDLYAANERIVAADIAALPLPVHSVDVALFCLSLMGTDFMSFLREAHRILRPDGRLWVSEIKSRFGDVDAKKFIDALAQIGFRLTEADRSNKMFINLDFVKVKPAGPAASTAVKENNHKVGMLLKPCTYKRR